jgi:hypothetical protein
MGLDTSGIRNLRRVENPTEQQIEDGYVFRFYVHEGIFERTQEGVDPNAYYHVSDAHADYFSGPGYSYGSHMGFRRALAKLVGVDADDIWDGIVTDCPFYDLINYSDCEGTIGPAACKRLASNFAEFSSAMEASADFPDVLKSRYRQWAEMFAWCADAEDGHVEFH